MLSSDFYISLSGMFKDSEDWMGSTTTEEKQ